MSLKLNSSGGGSITLQEPNTASNRTLTLPDNTGNLISSADSGTVSQAMLAAGVAGNGPSFSAYASGSQSIASGTWTKIQCNTEEWDTANCYDSSTNYRFTPNVAGYYQVNAVLGFQNNVTAPQCRIDKNGSQWKYGNNYQTGIWSGVSCLVYLNGTTDYIEFYGAHVNGNNQSTNGGQTVLNYFQAAFVRAA